MCLCAVFVVFCRGAKPRQDSPPEKRAPSQSLFPRSLWKTYLRRAPARQQLVTTQKVKDLSVSKGFFAEAEVVKKDTLSGSRCDLAKDYGLHSSKNREK